MKAIIVSLYWKFYCKELVSAYLSAFPHLPWKPTFDRISWNFTKHEDFLTFESHSWISNVLNHYFAPNILYLLKKPQILSPLFYEHCYNNSLSIYFQRMITNKLNLVDFQFFKDYLSYRYWKSKFWEYFKIAIYLGQKVHRLSSKNQRGRDAFQDQKKIVVCCKKRKVIFNHLTHFWW